MTPYRLITVWQIQAPRAAVFDAILDSRSWPRWWFGLQEVAELAPGDSRGVGSVRRYVWQSPMLYRLCFDARAERIEFPSRITASVSGDLVGSGEWHFAQRGLATAVRYDWRVCTTRAWMDRLAAILHCALVRNHRILMRRGGHGLARHLRAKLLAETTFEMSANPASGFCPPAGSSSDSLCAQLPPSAASGNRQASTIWRSLSRAKSSTK